MRNLLNLLAVLSFSGALFAQGPTTLDRDFSSGGDIRMHLHAGSYKISPSADNKIHLHWSTKDASALRKVKVTVDVSGKEAKIAADAPDNQNFRVEIQIPAHSDLALRFTAGELTLEGIEGSKDIFAYAGDLSIDVGDPAQYKEVHASVTTGDLDAAAFRVSKGGLFRSFNQTGTGPYTLRVKLRAGDLKLYERKKEAA